MLDIRSILKQILPQPVKTLIKKARILTQRGRRFYCPVCEKGFRTFFEFGVNPRPNVRCPGCGSLERHRLLWVALRDLQDKGLIQRGGANYCMWHRNLALLKSSDKNTITCQ